RRGTSGWSTASAVSANLEVSGAATTGVFTLVPSADFSKFVFTTSFIGGSYVSGVPSGSVDIFLTSDPAVEPSWLARPSVADPIPGLGRNAKLHDFLVAAPRPRLGLCTFPILV